MPTKRKNRARNRVAPLTAAEWQWLTGEPQADVNPFEALSFRYPWHPAHFDRMDSAIDRARGVLSPERLADRRAYVRGLRDEDRRRCPLLPEYRGERIHA